VLESDEQEWSGREFQTVEEATTKAHRQCFAAGKVTVGLAWHSAAREMSTSQSAVTLCGWGVKTGMDKRVGGR